jgi:putative flavoprotein involved in K+ transport
VAKPDVVVIGAGQAGLSVSHELSAAGVDHVVLTAELLSAAITFTQG